MNSYQQQQYPPNPFEKMYPITQTDGAQGGFTYTIFLFDYIDDVCLFAEICAILDSATEQDTVVFKINSPGGYLHAALTLIDAIRATKAQTIAECSGTVASAATIIALSCDGLYVAPHITWMTHYYTGGAYGKGHEILADVKHTSKKNKAVMREMYKKFHTKKEIELLIKGKDYYFTTEEVRERWNRVIDYRQARMTKAAEAQDAEQTQHVITELESRGYTVARAEEA